ncbi:SagB/ThcOx family dehydrogenase [Acinetobacter sp. WZC-1]|uniref:SagB/ThcOx family dehydrogenase n=1 Tax=Acinetobacter sp. WZC-1 TaxID=3459034 RepID=UPI00403E20AA
MQDSKIFQINEAVDADILKQIQIFHTKTCNRLLFNKIAFSRKLTNLNFYDLQSLPKTEQRMGGHLVDTGTQPQQVDHGRKSSASVFHRHDPLARDQLMHILNLAFGVDQDNTMPYPSGGALYSAQVFVYLNNITELDAGAYHYLPFSHQLEKVDCLDQEQVNQSLFIESSEEFEPYDFFIFYSLLAAKSASKYRFRGYRMGLMEVGSMYRNLEILAGKAALKSRVWGGFHDERLAVSLGMDPGVFLPVICQLVGRSR